MISEKNSAFLLCRGKVSSAKQQLLSKFSTNHAPIQYGVDYSNMVKHEKSNDKSILSPTKSLESKRLAFSQKPFQSTNNEHKETTNQSIKNQHKPSTFETVSSISFQKSPPVKRKVILISSSQKIDNTVVTINKGRNESSELKRRPHELKLSNVSNFIEPTKRNKSPKNINLNKDIQSPKSSTKQFVKQISNPEVLKDNKDTKNDESKKMNTNLRKSQTIIDPKSPVNSEFIDPSLVSVAQRAKYIMKTKPNKVTIKNVQSNLKNKNQEDEENEEPHLTIKDRINIFKENVTQTTAPLKIDISLRRSQNRFKTQPLSFDDIARANAMILDQTEVSSTIASPNLTNSNETLVDISEGSNSSITNVMNQPKTVARVKSCLLNQTTHFHKSIDEEELLPAINVKEFVKSHDKETEIISSPKLSRNPAVSRRLAFKNKSQTEDKSHSYVKRTHFTQPITKDENLIMNQTDDNKSINDRISSIQNNTNRWMLRIPKSPDEIGTSRPGSVYELQEKLQINQANWKTRVEQKDVEQFTTAAKIRSIQNRDNLTRHSFHGRAFKEGSPENICVVRLSKSDKPDQKPLKITLKSNFSSPTDDKCTSNNHSSVTNEVCTEDKNQINQLAQSHKVAVPQMSDKSLSNFFNESNAEEGTLSYDKPTSDDFNDIFLQTDLNLSITKKSVKPTRKQRTKSKNPLKSLNERTDIVEEYEERNYGFAEKEMKRCQVENIQLKAGYAEEALAALSSKEDFSKVKLKRTESGKIFEHFVSPYKDLMLISVKGRKKVQLRLVEPVASSINCGDCYLLLTGTRVFVWQGICANVIEINKVNELGSWIAKCKDLNYKGTGDKPTVVKSDDCPTNANVIQFWNNLKSDKVHAYNNPGAVDEDELYEQRIQTTNMVYQVVGNELIPMDEYWGRSLKYEMLSDNQVFIFDFGCELYLWSGNKADNSTRMHGRALLRQLWAKGYNYEECSINPLDPLPESPEKAKTKKASSRPEWVIVGRLPQRGETTLFKEKFSDWPESSRLIKVENGCSNIIDKKSSELDLKPADLDEVLKIKHPSVHLIIDGKSVGRGGTWKVIEDGILREFDVTTNKVEIWHIIDNNAIKVEEKSMGQFCNADAYIIRWDFELKTLGRFRRNQSTGNLSSVFFFWQGSRTTVTDKTASALHTIDLDKDKVTQIRVKQHDESPAFCRLFDGSMIIHQGKRKVVQQKLSTLRLFIIRGEVEGESHLVEVSCQPESLRARSTFLLLNTHSGSGYLWVGRLASNQSKVCGHYCVKSLNKRNPMELGLAANVSINVEEISQGDEHRSFWKEFDAVKRWRSWNTSMILEPIRGWLVSGVTDTFELNELKYSLNPDQDSNTIPAFPLVQSSLYKASQPALFIIWTSSHVYLWQGWWPHLTKSTSSESDIDIEDEEKDHDWSMPKNRIAAEKLASLKTLNSYLDKYESTGVSASIIYAGMEPNTFLELFPFWEINETAKLANIKKGYQMFQEDSIPQTLNKYITEKFPVSRLQRRPLPECVVLSKIEWYLTDIDFENLFKMSKEEFYEMTPWKQREKKKEVNLF